MVHANCMELFWAMLKHGYHRMFHQISLECLQRHIIEFAGCYNIRNLDTINQMRLTVCGMVGPRLLLQEFGGMMQNVLSCIVRSG